MLAVPVALSSFIWKLEMIMSALQGCHKHYVESTEAVCGPWVGGILITGGHHYIVAGECVLQALGGRPEWSVDGEENVPSLGST